MFPTIRICFKFIFDLYAFHPIFFFLTFFFHFNFSLNIFSPLTSRNAHLYRTLLTISRMLITESTKQRYKNNSTFIFASGNGGKRIFTGQSNIAPRNPQLRSLSFSLLPRRRSFFFFIYLFISSILLPFLSPFSFPSIPPYLSPFLEDTRCTGSYLRITLRVVDCALNRKQKPAAKGNRFTKGEGRRGEREGKSRSRTIRQTRAHTRR